MNRTTEPILCLPESVVQDVQGYRANVKKFLDGETSAVAFRAYRVPMGIYEQRTAGKYMVRIRIGAGLALPYQLERIAKLSKTYGSGTVHITTRQDIQIHEVNIEDTADVLEGLLEVGLSARGGGGNTVRNVTACPRAGVCPKEKFDVAPYAIACAEYLLQEASSFNLPRKYKIVFSGCCDDCAFASVADLAFFAHNKDSIKGFAVYAGGGLGPNPSVGVKIEDFIRDDEIFEVAEAVKRFFDEYGDRSNKHKARLRYVLARLGVKEFVKLYKQHRSRVQSEGLVGDIPQIRDEKAEGRRQKSEDKSKSESQLPANVLAEKNPDLFTVRLRIDRGEIAAETIVKIGQIAEKFGSGIVRTTQLQDILISGVAKEDIEAVKTAAEEAGIDASGNSCPKIVVCAGAATCKLGLCLSRGLADAVAEQLHEVKTAEEYKDLVIRISGCPNSCANHYIADIGFEGKAKRIDDKLMPFYDVLVGAKIAEGRSRLAENVGTVPAKRIPQLTAEALSNGTIEKEQIKNLTARYSDVASKPFPDNYYYDFGATEPFSLAGRGPGECGAGVMDVIKMDIDEAKEAIQRRKKEKGKRKSESVYEAIVAAARALMVTFGLEPKKDREIFTAFSKHLIEPGWVRSQTQQLLNEAIDWRIGDRDLIDDLALQAEDLTKRVEELFLSLDANLKFKVKPAAQKTNIDRAETKNHIIDLRGVECPLNFVKAKLELEKIAVGRILEVLLDDGEPVRNVPESFAQQGQEVIEVKNSGDHFCVKVRRKR